LMDPRTYTKVARKISKQQLGAARTLIGAEYVSYGVKADKTNGRDVRGEAQRAAEEAAKVTAPAGGGGAAAGGGGGGGDGGAAASAGGGAAAAAGGEAAVAAAGGGDGGWDDDAVDFPGGWEDDAPAPAICARLTDQQVSEWQVDRLRCEFETVWKAWHKFMTAVDWRRFHPAGAFPGPH
jgi:hypothetical protein